MKQLLDKIDKYLYIQEKKDVISLSLNHSNDMKDIIEIIKKSDDKEKTLSMFTKDIREKIEKLIEGGIL